MLLRYCEDVLLLQITDDGQGATVADGAGHGLTGMRERVALYNGTLRTGPLPAGGGYQVTATLPLSSLPVAGQAGPAAHPHPQPAAHIPESAA